MLGVLNCLFGYSASSIAEVSTGTLWRESTPTNILASQIVEIDSDRPC